MNPWLSIPAADYDGHMGPDGADQQAPLAAIFAQVYAASRPSSVALLGCATGNGLGAIDPAVTPRIVGIDLNPEYLAVARQRHADLGGALDLRCADLLTWQLEGGGFALIQAALVFEHVDPTALAARIASWLEPAGICSVVLQLQRGARPATPVAASRFSSLQALAGSMHLVPRMISGGCSRCTASPSAAPGRSRCGATRRSTSASTRDSPSLAVDAPAEASCRA